MYINDTIIDAIMHIPTEEQGQALVSVINYIKGEEVDADALAGSAYAVFILAKTVLAPRMRRRAKRAEQAREKTLPEKQSPCEIPSSEHNQSPAREVPISERHKSDAMEKTSHEDSQFDNSQNSTPKLPRAERRRREREMRKATRRAVKRSTVIHDFYKRLP